MLSFLLHLNRSTRNINISYDLLSIILYPHSNFGEKDTIFFIFFQQGDGHEDPEHKLRKQ